MDRVLFDGSQKSAWEFDQSAAPDRITSAADPITGAGSVLDFFATNADVAPLTPTVNPRAQLVSPRGILTPGRSYWESWQLYLPYDFPAFGAGDRTAWLALVTAAYGPPYAGSPPVMLSIRRNRFVVRNWRRPLTRGRWLRFTWNFRLAQDGWLRMYYQGRRVTFPYGPTRTPILPLATIDQTDSAGPWSARLHIYFRLGSAPQLRVYFKDFRIATTRYAAEHGKVRKRRH